MNRMGFDESNINAHLVEKQLKRWNARCRAFKEKVVDEPAFQFLTVAEDEGSLGNEITGELSVRLGWHIFDEEIIHYIAQNSNVSDELVRKLDKKSQSGIQETIERFLKTIEVNSFSGDDYHEGLMVTLLCLAKQGSAILVGRGANFALNSEKRGLKVRLTASPKIRIRRLAELWKVDTKEARRRMLENDEEKKKFIHHYYYHDYDDVRFYDVIFNTDRTPVDRIVSSILGFVYLPAEAKSSLI
jgi:cytidylate kinase